MIHEEHRGAGYIEKLRSWRAIAERFPQVKVSADQPYRLTDLAIDYAEQVPRAADDIVDADRHADARRGLPHRSKQHPIHAYYPANERPMASTR